MPVSPIGIFAARDPARAAEPVWKYAAPTHTHPVCLAASAAYAAAIACGIAGGSAGDKLVSTIYMVPLRELEKTKFDRLSSAHLVFNSCRLNTAG